MPQLQLIKMSRSPHKQGPALSTLAQQGQGERNISRLSGMCRAGETFSWACCRARVLGPCSAGVGFTQPHTGTQPVHMQHRNWP